MNRIRTGLFVSPHIACFRERIQIDNDFISEDQFLHYYDAVYKLCVELRVPATEFEVAFLMACLHFRDSGCQAVVLEVELFVAQKLLLL
jgi:dihydrofolate synthase / folylpolyglutamate synthase